MNKMLIVASFFCSLFLLSGTSEAENLICRGANRPILEKGMEKLIKQKFKDLNVEVKKVQVRLVIVGARPKASLDLSSMSSGISIVPSPLSVTDSATYPDPTACLLNVKEYIQVITKDNQVSRSVRDIQLGGHLLSGAKGFDDSKGD